MSSPSTPAGLPPGFPASGAPGLVAGEARDTATQIIVGGNIFGNVGGAGHHLPRPPLRQLPGDVPGFSGRSTELAAIETLSRSTAAINIYGMPGVGKSALATHAAHVLTPQFPGHHLYVDLKPTGRSAVDTGTILKGLLIALGLPASELPAGVPMLAGIFRSLVHGQRSLLIIDNAANADHVRHLLPGQPDSLVLITSWTPLAELDGTELVALGRMSRHSARRLLASASGRTFREADAEPANAIIASCDALPLALRIAGGALKARPHWNWSTLAQRLADRTTLLARLEQGHLSVRSSFQLSYDALDPQLARTFRFLALAPSQRITPAVTSALTGTGPGEALDLLDTLEAHQLLVASTAETFGMHDLLWLFASELLASNDPPAEVSAARERLAAWYQTSLATDYLDRVGQVHEHIAPLWSEETRRITEIFVPPTFVLRASGLESGRAEGRPAVQLEEILRQPRVAVVAGGGAGKTTLVNFLCTRLATANRDSDRLLPFVLFARDLTLEDLRTGLDEAIIRTVRGRYGYELNRDSLNVAFSACEPLLVVDGLDEIADEHLRRALLGAIDTFAHRWPRVRILLTSREYYGVDTDLGRYRQYSFTDLSSGDRRAIGHRLLSNTVSPDLLEALDNSFVLETTTTPLEVVMTYTAMRTRGLIPAGEDVVEALLDRTIFDHALRSRDRSRRISRSLQPDTARIRTFLEHVALHMQERPNRIYISWDDLLAIGEEADYPPGAIHELVRTETARAVFRPADSEPDSARHFCFTHTAYREHLAAAHLGHSHTSEFLRYFTTAPEDASWDNVLAKAARLRAKSIGDKTLQRLAKSTSRSDRRARVISILEKASLPAPTPRPITDALATLHEPPQK